MNISKNYPARAIIGGDFLADKLTLPKSLLALIAEYLVNEKNNPFENYENEIRVTGLLKITHRFEYPISLQSEILIKIKSIVTLVMSFKTIMIDIDVNELPFNKVAMFVFENLQGYLVKAFDQIQRNDKEKPQMDKLLDHVVTSVASVHNNEHFMSVLKARRQKWLMWYPAPEGWLHCPLIDRVLTLANCNLIPSTYQDRSSIEDSDFNEAIRRSLLNTKTPPNLKQEEEEKERAFIGEEDPELKEAIRLSLLKEEVDSVSKIEEERKESSLIKEILKNKPLTQEFLNSLGYVDQQKNGKTALMYAAEISNPIIINQLLERKPDLELKSIEGNTALMHAAAKVHPLSQIIIGCLVRAGAKLSAKNNKGQTACDIAVEANQDAGVIAKLFP